MKSCEECKRKNSILMESKSRGKTERNRERDNDRRKGGKEGEVANSNRGLSVHTDKPTN
jgi:hypothetical protein